MSMWKLVLSLALLLTVIALIIVALVETSDQRAKSMATIRSMSEVAEILRILHRMPSPELTEKGNIAGQTQILKDLDALDQFGTSDLRLALQQFELEVGGFSARLEEMSKIMLMNRYIFKAPARRPTSWIAFHSWWVESTDPMSHIAPLAMDESGQIIYDPNGEFRAYMGPGYGALEEFDHFHKSYGRRKVPGPG